MADVTKYELISSTNGSGGGGGGGSNNYLFSDMKSQFSLFKTKKKGIVGFVYGFMFCFVVFTVILAFSPSTNSSAPWFLNLFTTTTTSNSSTTATAIQAPVYSEQSYRSHFSSIFSYIFPNSPQSDQNLSSSVPSPTSGSTISTSSPLPTSDYPPPTAYDENARVPRSKNQAPIVQNNTNSQFQPIKEASLKSNQTVEVDVPPPVKSDAESDVPAMKDGGTNSSVLSNFKSNGTAVLAQTSAPTVAPPAEKKQDKADSDKKAVPVEKEDKKKADDVALASAPPPAEEKNLEQNGNGVDTHTPSTNAPPPPSPLYQKQINSNKTVVSAKQGKESDLIDRLLNCDLYDGGWVRDESYPLYKPGACSFFDEQFGCQLNGRPDSDYMKLKWQPKGCTLPRLNAKRMLQMLKGKRLVFVGDSLNRNMWESLVCILKQAVKDHKKVYEAHGKHSFRTEAVYSFVFQDYKLTVEFFVSPFLVQQWQTKDKNGTTKDTLRIDLIAESAPQFKGADFLIFNTGHWWTHYKTSKGQDYYQEGSHVYSEMDVVEAFRRALTTWGRWIDANVNPSKTQVLFRGYSASHFSGGQWNSGGSCSNESEPIKNETYLNKYPWKMKVLEKVIKGMKNPISYLNVTKLTDYRKDGHPSVYRRRSYAKPEAIPQMQVQDCSHWCLPGVPDAWNELLYAELVRKQYKDKQQARKALGT